MSLSAPDACRQFTKERMPTRPAEPFPRSGAIRAVIRVIRDQVLKISNRARGIGTALNTIVLAACASVPKGIDPRVVQPERPSVATHAGTVAPGFLEIETGIESDRNADGTHALVVPTVLKF